MLRCAIVNKVGVTATRDSFTAWRVKCGRTGKYDSTLRKGTVTRADLCVYIRAHRFPEARGVDVFMQRVYLLP